VKNPGIRFKTRSAPIPIGGVVKAGEVQQYNSQTGQSFLEWVVYTTYSDRSSNVESVWDYNNPGPPFLTGGPFKRIQVGLPYVEIKDTGSYISDPADFNPWTHWGYRYVGGFCNPPWYQYLDEFSDQQYIDIASSGTHDTLVPDLSSLGDSAYSKLRPKLEKADMGIFIAEMRDASGMLTGSRDFIGHKVNRAKGNLKASSESFANYFKRIGGNLKATNMLPKRVASEFVNTQFGWAPFIGDLQKLNNATLNAQRYFAQIERDNNQWVRRRRADKIIESEQLLWTQYDPGIQPTSIYGSMIYKPGASYTIKLQEYTEVWYEGVFKYYRPEFDVTKDYGNFTAVRDIDRHLTLLGLQVNPMLIWKAYPWTWAVDWFVKVGDNIQLAQDLATDSVASKYMYLMHHSFRRFELRSKFETWDGKKHDLVWYRYFDIKRRESADSSYSFRLANPLSGRQLAILAALGLSRAH